jgi:hypothetical protein
MSNTGEFWEYAADAMVDARHAKDDTERRALLDLSRMWTQAALRSEGPMVVIAGQAAEGDSVKGVSASSLLRR